MPFKLVVYAGKKKIFGRDVGNYDVLVFEQRGDQMKT